MPYNQKLACMLTNLILTLLICFQYSDNDFGRGEVSRDVLYEPGGRADVIRVVFSRYLSSIPSAIKKIIDAINV